VYGRYGTTNTERKHLLRGAKGSVWEGGVRVACLMKWPAEGKIPAGSVCNELIAGFDLYTTFAAVAGADIPHDRVIDGKDIRSLMFHSGSAARANDKISGQDGSSERSLHDVFYYYQANRLGAVRQGKWKLMFAPGAAAGAPAKKAASPANKWPQLFDLDADIAETTDVATEHPDVVKRLETLAEAARDDLGDSSQGRRGRNIREPGHAP
jgi:arylsulfatase A